MSKFEQIKDRYTKGFVTEQQLQKYVELAVITEDQANEIKNGYGNEG